MGDAARRKVSTDEVIARATAQPAGRHELLGGEVVAKAPESNAHALTKLRAVNALAAAVERARLGCAALPDGATVRIDAFTAFEPDASATCAPGDLAGVEVADPAIAVEAVTASSRGVDAGLRLSRCFSLPSVRRYLILDTDRRAVIHHARAGNGAIAAMIRGEGPFRLDPPGLESPVEAMLLPPVS